MNIFSALLKKEWLELVRSKRLLILAVLFLFFAISSPIFAKLIPSLLKNIPGSSIQISIPEATYKDAIDQLVKNISQLGMIGLVFIFAGMVAEEKNRRTFELLLAKPISRNSIILSKIISAAMAVLVIFIVSDILFYTYTVTIFGSFDLAHFITLSALLLLILILITTLTIFASVITSNTITAAAVAFAGEVTTTVVASMIDKIAKYTPGYFFSNYKTLVESGWNKDFLPSAITMSVLTIILGCISVAIFQKQEIER